MAKNATLAEMRATARELADMEKSTFISDAWLNKRINEHCERLYDKLIIAYGEQYYTITASASAVADQSLYTWEELGAQDFYRLVELVVDDGSDYASCPAYDYTDLPYLLELENTVGFNDVHQLRRQIRKNGVNLLPAPGNTSITITLYYIPGMPELVLDDDQFDGINGWERWACLGAAIDMRNKEEADASGLLIARSEIEQQIDQLAGTRDMARPRKVKRTRRRRRFFWRYGDDDAW